MTLLDALDVASVEELDPAHPPRLGPFELGIEATEEAIAILSDASWSNEVSIFACPFETPTYWLVRTQSQGSAELFGFPNGAVDGLTTATEIALVRAIAAADVNVHASILGGGVGVALGSPIVWRPFQRVLEVVKRPLAGTSLLFDQSTEVLLDDEAGSRVSTTVLHCLSNSFRTSPLKFRFLELYRMMEARFLADVKHKLFARFATEPVPALNEALESLGSEVRQIVGLAEAQQDAFEACYIILDTMNNTNRFVTALFRILRKKTKSLRERWQIGAALVYQMRCAVVHAGEIDMIFENFGDAEDAIDAVLPAVERAALGLVGVKVV